MALTEEQQRLNEEAIQNTIDEWAQNQTSDKIKGLAEKNESFKGMTSPGRIDAQIAAVVCLQYKLRILLQNFLHRFRGLY